MDDLLDYIPDGVFTVDDQWHITLFNRAAEKITGIPQQDAMGRRCCDVFRASICESACALKQTLATGRQASGMAARFITAWRGAPRQRTPARARVTF